MRIAAARVTAVAVEVIALTVPQTAVARADEVAEAVVIAIAALPLALRVARSTSTTSLLSLPSKKLSGSEKSWCVLATS